MGVGLQSVSNKDDTNESGALHDIFIVTSLETGVTTLGISKQFHSQSRDSGTV